MKSGNNVRNDKIDPDRGLGGRIENNHGRRVPSEVHEHLRDNIAKKVMIIKLAMSIVVSVVPFALSSRGL